MPHSSGGSGPGQCYAATLAYPCDPAYPCAKVGNVRIDEFVILRLVVICGGKMRVEDRIASILLLGSGLSGTIYT